jgi:uncharacterized protein (DUF924 family)/predicted GNAT family acetyltransferase
VRRDALVENRPSTFDLLPKTAMPIEIRHVPAEHRFETTVNGARGIAEYRLEDRAMLLTHTEVAPELRGRGIAGQLVQAALDHARAERLEVRPLCAYARRYLQRQGGTATSPTGGNDHEPVKAPSVASEAREVLDFWFGPPGSPLHGTQRPEWFRKDEAFDASIRGRFGALLERGLRGELAAWADTAQGALAQVIVLDQFTRNAWRGTPRAFAGDDRALAAAQAMVTARQDAALPPEQRAFVYLPFEHAESLALQEDALRHFRSLAAEAPDMAESLDYAERHHAIVQRFGRFPHRNAILGRASTAEEIAFLEQPGSSF